MVTDSEAIQKLDLNKIFLIFQFSTHRKKIDYKSSFKS